MGDRRFVLGPHATYECDDLDIEVDYSSATIRATDWEIDAMGQPVRNWISGARHRLDIGTAFTGNYGQDHRPHGLVGQSFDGSHAPRRGRVDRYPAQGNFTTSAMAEGAIDGREQDHRVAQPYGTEFRFSAMPHPRPVKLRRRRLQLSASGGVNSICCQACISRKWKFCVIPGSDNTLRKVALPRQRSYAFNTEMQYWQDRAG